MGIPLCREGPPSAAAAPSEAATPVGFEEHKPPWNPTRSGSTPEESQELRVSGRNSAPPPRHMAHARPEHSMGGVSW